MSRKTLNDTAGRSAIDVWLSPSRGGDVAALAAQLGKRFHLLVVPKTGSRRVDVAVLSDADPAELETVARILPGVPLIATSTNPSDALIRATNQAGAQLLTSPSVDKVLSEIAALDAARRINRSVRVATNPHY